MGINEIVLYQVDKKDSNRFNNHAYRHGVKLKGFSFMGVYVFIFIPEKKLMNGSVILNQSFYEKFILFEKSIRDNEINFFRKVYEEKNFSKFGFVD